jgi:dCTP deaminase
MSSTPWILLIIYTSKDIKYFLPIKYSMILSASEFSRRLDTDSGTGRLVINPYHKECQQPASYDLRAAMDVTLARGTCTLVSTIEWVELPTDLAGTLMCRSSFGRRGLLLGAGYVDPGFRGQLTLCLTNMGINDICIRENDRIAQIILHEVLEGSHGYSGRYQDSSGAVEAK